MLPCSKKVSLYWPKLYCFGCNSLLSIVPSCSKQLFSQGKNAQSTHDPLATQHQTADQVSEQLVDAAEHLAF